MDFARPSRRQLLAASATIGAGISRRMALFADVKKIWISVDADGTAPGGIGRRPHPA